MNNSRLIPGASSLSLDEVWTLNLQKSQQNITGVYGKRALGKVDFFCFVLWGKFYAFGVNFIKFLTFSALTKAPYVDWSADLPFI